VNFCAAVSSAGGAGGIFVLFVLNVSPSRDFGLSDVDDTDEAEDVEVFLPRSGDSDDIDLDGRVSVSSPSFLLPRLNLFLLTSGIVL